MQYNWSLLKGGLGKASLNLVSLQRCCAFLRMKSKCSQDAFLAGGVRTVKLLPEAIAFTRLVGPELGFCSSKAVFFSLLYYSFSWMWFIWLCLILCVSVISRNPLRKKMGVFINIVFENEQLEMDLEFGRG